MFCWPWKKLGTTASGDALYCAPLAEQASVLHFTPTPKQPGVYTLMFGPPSLPPDPTAGLHDLFAQCIDGTSSLAGWKFAIAPASLNNFGHVRISLGCPHGYDYTQTVSPALLEQVSDPQVIVGAMLKNGLDMCHAHHAPPPKSSATGVYTGPHPLDPNVTPPSVNPREELAALFPGLAETMLCPTGRGCHEAGGWMSSTHSPYSPNRPIGELIIHLNDGHKWTREQIAAWIDSLDIDFTLQSASVGD